MFTNLSQIVGSTPYRPSGPMAMQLSVDVMDYETEGGEEHDSNGGERATGLPPITITPVEMREVFMDASAHSRHPLSSLRFRVFRGASGRWLSG